MAELIRRGLVRPAGNVVERLGKRLRHAMHWLKLLGRGAPGGQAGRPPSVVAWPELPGRRTTLHGICHELGWELTNRRRSRAVARIRFEDATEKAAPLPKNWGDVPVLNGSCTDIRKSTLEEHHVAVFGYGMAVDPVRHKGAMLEKGDGNALHDGRVVTGPFRSEQVIPGKVYQTVIDNRSSDGRLVDLRVAWIQGAWPVAYLKYKSPTSRFTNTTVDVTLADAGDLFTSDELLQMGEVLKRMDVDFAEVDVLRDRGSGDLFLVDVNPTPWGPPSGLPEPAKKLALNLLAQSFSRASTF